MDANFRKIQERLRTEYSGTPLDEETCHDSPYAQFRLWFEEALAHEEGEVNAMSLSTVAATGRVSSRMVLLKDFSESGFTFFTNFSSRKGAEISNNPWVALLFYWPRLERQVRIEGIAKTAPNSISDEYFAQRPRSAQLGAIISKQSAELAGRQALETEVSVLDKRFENRALERPVGWGGYQVTPESFEFWQGRPDRLHDRVFYEPAETGWRRGRLYP